MLCQGSAFPINKKGKIAFIDRGSVRLLCRGGGGGGHPGVGRGGNRGSVFLIKKKRNIAFCPWGGTATVSPVHKSDNNDIVWKIHVRNSACQLFP